MIVEIRLRADRRGGELLIEMKENGELHNGHGDQKSESHRATPILSDIGVTKNYSSRCQAIAALPEEVLDQHIATAKAVVTQVHCANVLHTV